MYKYIFDKETLDKVEKSLIFEKLENFKKTNGSFGKVYGHINEEDFLWQINTLPDVLSDFKNKLETIINSTKSFWEFQGKEIKIDKRDLMMISGYKLSDVLDIKESLDYAKYGFKNSIDFILTLGAYIDYRDNNYISQENEFSKKNINGYRIIITGNTHGDLEFYKINENFNHDIKNSLGDNLGFHPVLSTNENALFPGQSSEIPFLTEILKYAHQIGYTINYENILNSTKNLANIYGAFGELGGDDFFDKMCLENSFDWDIPSNLEDGIRYIGDYIIKINSDNHLLFYHKNNHLEIRASIDKNDIDIIIEGLIVQASKGHGRTSKTRILNILQYYFSSFRKSIYLAKKIK